MKRKRKTELLLALCSLAACSISTEALAKEETLKVGVRDDIMHMSYLNPLTEKYYGFEVDLAAAVAAELGYKDVEYVTVTPETRKEMLQGGSVDCLIASYSVEESRKEVFDFSPSYYTDSSCVMVEDSTLFNSFEDLVGSRVGVLDGANAGPKLAEKLIDKGLITEDDAKGSELVKYDSYSDMSVALEEGQVDAVCMDGCIARAYMQDDRAFLEETIDEEDYAVATQKDSELSEKMAETVQKLLDDGTVDSLIEKWR